MKKIISLSSLLFLFISLCTSNEKELQKNYNSIEVKNYLKLNEIFDVDISKGNFKVISEIVQTWVDKTLTAEKNRAYSKEKLNNKLSEIWHPIFIINNQENERKTLAQTLVIEKNGNVKLYEKFLVTLSMDTDIKEYPFGSLDLQVDISAFHESIDKMIFIPEYFQIGEEDANNAIKGNWSIIDYYSKNETKKSFLFNKINISHNEFHFKIKHDFTDALQKIFIPLLIVILISLLINFFCRMKYKENYEFNINGQLVLLLTIVALRFSLNEELPKTHYLNLTDLLFLSSFIIPTICLIGSIIIMKMYQNNHQERAEYYENYFAYFTILIAILLLSLSSLISLI
jgi:hypothetical protein